MSRRAMPPHPFRIDWNVPPDHNGHHACLCGLVGEPGDAHHDMPEPADPDARELAAHEED